MLTLKFDISSTGLITDRTLNNTWVIFIGGLLGSVFGIMGLVAALMGISESVKNKLSITLFKYSTLPLASEERMRLHSHFQDSRVRNRVDTEAAATNMSAKNQSSIGKIYPETSFDQDLAF